MTEFIEHSIDKVKKSKKDVSFNILKLKLFNIGLVTGSGLILVNTSDVLTNIVSISTTIVVGMHNFKRILEQEKLQYVLDNKLNSLENKKNRSK